MKNFVIPNRQTPDPGTLSEYLSDSIQALSDLIHVPITYFDASSQIVKEFGAPEKICGMFDVYHRTGSPCRNNLASAGQFVSRLGEPYIFMCKAGLMNIATALIIHETFAGYFIAGPLVVGELRNSTTEKFASLNGLDSAALSTVWGLARQMKVYQPNEIPQLALLLHNGIQAALSENRDYATLRNQYSEQNKINNDIQRYKKEQVPMEYPRDLENQLISNIHNGQAEAARVNIEALLKEFSILEAGELDGIKAKTLWFFSNAIRTADQNGESLSQFLDTDLDIINKLSETDSFSRLLSLSQSLIETIAKNRLASVYSGASRIVTQALQYINENYRRQISLKDISDHLYVNASYFSALFKQEMGVTFTDYLNSVKADRACDLLTGTSLSIVDISLSTGFGDQSYFTRVFKKIKGVTPKEYRSSHGTGSGRS